MVNPTDDPNKTQQSENNIIKRSTGSHQLLGKKFLDYRITGVLGEGGMGVVYKAYQESLDREVALKLLPGLKQDSKQLAQLKTEARIVAKFTHPNMVTVHQLGEDAGQLFVVMELCNGHTLEVMIEKASESRFKNRKFLPLRATLDIITQIARALEYAHKRQVVHLDIKPANVMVNDEHQVKVMDFGLAKFVTLTPSAPTDMIVGTPSYMSPEQTLGKVLDGRSDIFSLGVLFYEALTGEKPFTGDNTPSLFNAIHDHVPKQPSEINPEVSQDLDAMIFVMMEKHRDDRYRSINILLEDLELMKRKKPTGAFKRVSGYHKSMGSRKSQTKVYRLKKRKSKKNPVLLWVVILFILAGILVFGIKMGAPYLRGSTPRIEKAESIKDFEIAKNYMLNHRNDLAEPILKKIVLEFPDSDEAARANALLLQFNTD